jgi:methyl-accepting chemotaxis protein
MSELHRHRPVRSRTTRVLVSLAAGPALLLGVASCGDDDGDQSASVCDARDDFESSVQTLRDVDVVSGGTDALEAAAQDVRSALDRLDDAARDEFGDEVDAVRASLDELADALRSFGDDGNTSDAASKVSDAATAVVDDTTHLRDELDSACA